ncbi:spinster family MFS transporter [Sphingomonas sp. SRS2]|uniref:spinster family MFS transporter n=1 Tax=Sphingomonas sp. SRS2 TaxID=133190 RepID=UPI00061843D7|nr:MFS transporter [Sphingomonas sp. SRS2]KKC25204.1 hypothetical protein WP12_15100 [Sphingomonas sp. SRS2]
MTQAQSPAGALLSDAMEHGAGHQGWSPSRRRVALGALMVAYGLNIADRQLISILAGPIKADLRLSDTEIGLMGGVAFAIFYAACALPLSFLADRWSRANVIAIGLGLWSFFTLLCGAAQSGLHLFLARLGVGFGEAGGAAPSFSLVASYYPPEGRARAVALLNFASPIGAGLGPLLGAVIASLLHWRWAFIIAGAVGLIFVPFFRWAVRDPSPAIRPKGVEAIAAMSADERKASIGRLLRSHCFWFLAIGSAISSMVLNGMVFWLPSFLQRSFGLDIISSAVLFAMLTTLGGIVGVWVSGWTMDRFGTNKRLYVLYPAIAGLASLPFYSIGLNAASIWIATPLLFVGVVLSFSFPTPIYVAVQHLVPAGLRSTSTATFLFINNSIGIGLGIVLLGFISDRLASTFGTDSLKYSLLATLILYPIAAIPFWISARSIKRGWIA